MSKSEVVSHYAMKLPLCIFNSKPKIRFCKYKRIYFSIAIYSYFLLQNFNAVEFDNK